MGGTSSNRAYIKLASDEEKALRNKVKCKMTIEEIVQQCLGDKGSLEKDGSDVPLFLKKLEKEVPTVSDVIEDVNAEMLFARFDANTDERLCRRECFAIVEAILNFKINQLSGDDDPDIPRKSLDDHYSKTAQLGEGGQGIMHLATNKAGERRCVKQFRKGDANAPLENIKKEFQCMKSFNSPYVARTYEIFQDWRHVYIVSEPYDGGDLTKLATNAKNAGVTMNELWYCEIFKQLLKGLVYIHQFGLIHCDIKPENVMIADNSNWHSPHAILIDFGLGRKFVCNEQGLCGTPGYIPPEVFKKGYWVEKGDVFSAGVSIYAVLSGDASPLMTDGILQMRRREFLRRIEHRTCDEELPLDRLSTSPISNCNEPLTQSTLKTLRKMLSKDVGSRPTAAQCLKEKCFRTEATKPALDFNTLQQLRQVQNLDWTPAQQAASECVLSNRNLSEASQRGANEMFRRLDVNGDGTISVEEAKTGLRKVPGLNDSSINGIIEALRGESDKVTYLQFVSRMVGRKALEEGVSDLFHRIDVDGDGYITKGELPALMKACRYDSGLHTILMNDLDENDDKKISLDEFKQAISRKAPQESRWTCPVCGEVNNAHRSECNMCKASVRGVKRGLDADGSMSKRQKQA